MYVQIVAMLFPLYVCGCILALALSWSRRSLYLAFSYSYILITFQFFISGRAQELGYRTFLYCAAAQLIMGLCAVITRAKGSRAVAVFSLSAILVNLLAMGFSLSGHPIRQVYFAGINLIQTLQILTLIAASPLWAYTYSKLRHPRQKESSWMLMEIPPT